MRNNNIVSIRLWALSLFLQLCISKIKPQIRCLLDSTSSYSLLMSTFRHSIHSLFMPLQSLRSSLVNVSCKRKWGITSQVFGTGSLRSWTSDFLWCLCMILVQLLLPLHLTSPSSKNFVSFPYSLRESLHVCLCYFSLRKSVPCPLV